MKKARLLKQKIITNAHIAHNNSQYRLQELTDAQDLKTNSVNQNITDFIQGLNDAIAFYEESVSQLKPFHKQHSGNGDSSACRFDFVSSQHLKDYLKVQKNALKQMVQKAESGVLVKQEDKIHRLIRKNKLNCLLHHLRKKQLDDQIKYLSQHIITSSGLIYIPDTQVIPSEEASLDQKIETLLAEVERLIQLELVCENSSSNQEESCDFARKALNNQLSRLEYAEKILSNERDQVASLEKWINGFDEFMEKLPSPALPLFSQLKNSKETVQQIDWEELKILECLHPQEGSIVDCRNCDWDEISGSLRRMMLRANKIK